MKLNVVGLQSGPNGRNESYHHRIEQLSAQFDKVITSNPHIDLIVFPELMTVPYFCKFNDKRFFELAEPLDGPTFTYFAKKAREANVNIIITIFEKSFSNKASIYYNTAIVISNDGEMIGKYRKTHIPKLSLSTLKTDETIYFSRGTDYPVFDIKGFKIGILICFDRSFPEASRSLALQGADVIIIPTAAAGEERKNVWLSECQARARENGLYVIGVNKAGVETLVNQEVMNSSTFFGLSCAFDPSGTEIGGHLGSESWKSLSVEIDKSKINKCRERLNFLDFLQGDLYFVNSEEIQQICNFKMKQETVPLFGPKGAVFH
ncbi:carbon-nitrogen hydrolase family protein [Metabacillus litoralis]|jgi:N-carbamoylputrescine amidase|uniref:carbon-nitrogen hydrolase family protein n=1 Tax=Metabacillus litoralis TaxID=152268 RepID=UPI0020404FAC|nr:carbon-nitrogen hydrolase family protein [Metabacillus litoralis]MCM3653814.1 carbon-nitrogen hydrolase family protein [Metabacillus litoralis]